TRRARSLEPRMLIGGVIEDQIHEDSDVALFGFTHEPIEVGHGAVHGVDGGVVGDVVAEVNLRRGIHRGEPDGSNVQILEVVKAGNDAVDVAYAVAIGILEAARIDFVYDGVLPPRIV